MRFSFPTGNFGSLWPPRSRLSLYVLLAILSSLIAPFFLLISCGIIPPGPCSEASAIEAIVRFSTWPVFLFHDASYSGLLSHFELGIWALLYLAEFVAFDAVVRLVFGMLGRQRSGGSSQPSG